MKRQPIFTAVEKKKESEWVPIVFFAEGEEVSQAIEAQQFINQLRGIGTKGVYRIQKYIRFNK